MIRMHPDALAELLQHIRGFAYREGEAVQTSRNSEIIQTLKKRNSELEMTNKDFESRIHNVSKAAEQRASFADIRADRVQTVASIVAYCTKDGWGKMEIEAFIAAIGLGNL